MDERKNKLSLCRKGVLPVLSITLPLAAATVFFCASFSYGLRLDFGISQEIGYEEHLRVSDRTGSDGYSETAFSTSLSHPLAFRQGRLTFDPSLSLSYTNYFRSDALDPYFAIHTPLRFEFLRGLRGRQQPDALEITGSLSRDLVTVSTRTGERAVRSELELATLYTRHLRFARWKVESGYDFRRTLYDETRYEHRERDDHIMSLAMLYALTPKMDIGLGGRYKIENFLEHTENDAATSEISVQTRWDPTGRLEGRAEVGYETVDYRHIDRDEEGITLRGRLDWRPTERWRCLADLRHEFDITAEDESGSRVDTTRASLGVTRHLTRRLQVGLTPAIRHEGGDPRVIEYIIDLTTQYAFRLFDFTLQTGVTDRRSDADDDEYTAARALVRFDFEF